MALAGCGGGGSSSLQAPPVSGGAGTEARVQAATVTAQNHPDCRALGPFYWEIGDAGGRLAGATVGAATPTAQTVMSIASASKWLYASYWLERTGGVVSAGDRPFFNFTSGYTEFAVTGCLGALTVGGCAALGSNGVLDPAKVGRFEYGGGHMQVHAARDPRLAPMNSAALAAEIGGRLGGVAMSYGQPQLAGGARMSPAAFAQVLRGMLDGSLRMGDALGTLPVCVDPATCATAVSTPTPAGEQWHYSIGHWVEDDPQVGDGAFSSLGAFGFYPWIDASKTWYGVVAREDIVGARSSIACGQVVRRAWVTSTVQ